MGLDKLNKKIEIKNEKNIKILILTLILHHVMLYLFDITDRFRFKEPWPWPHNISLLLMTIVVAAPVVFVYFKFSLNKEKVNIKNWKQYIIGILLYIPVWLVAQINYGRAIPADFSDYARYEGDMLWTFFYYFFCVALYEEFMFRVYVQGELQIIMGKAKFLAPLITGILFGYAHIVNGDMEQVLLTTAIGIVLGYAKYFIKDCTFISVVIAHGLYDYILTWGLPFF